jgi:putative colanic acid biosynthesis glycosyltransferase
MKVLLIDVNCKNSSTGKIVYDLYTELRKNNHTAAVCYGRGPVVKEPDILKFSSDVETYAHAFLTRLTGLTGVYSPFATRRLINFMEVFKPDIVHLHELHAYFVNIGPVMNHLKKNNIKTIWTFHCEFMYTGKCGHADDCEKWKSECGRCPKVREYPASIYFDFTRKMFRQKKHLFDGFENLVITTPSNWLAKRVEQSFLKDKDIKVIANGIDTKNTFYPRPFAHLKKNHGLKEEKIVLAVAPGLMSDNKGGKWVLDLAKRLKNENMKFILIGIDDLTQKFDDNVIALGRTQDQHELAQYYSMADVFLICSRKETFSMPCAESLACGTPVIGFDSGAPIEVAPENYGIFVQYGDIQELEKTTRNLLKGTIIIKTKEECADYARSKFSKQEMYNKYLNLYCK